IAGSTDLGLFEVNEAAEIIHNAANPDANIIFGQVVDDSMGDEVRVTVIAAGFDRWDTENGEVPAGAAASANNRNDDIFDDAIVNLTESDEEFELPSFLK